MAIRYLETYHECRCDCGQIFFVRARRYFTSPLRDPDVLMARCPACNKLGKLTDSDRKRSVNSRQPKRPIHHEVRILFEDLPDMEAAIKVSRQRAQFHYNQWAGLMGVVKEAIVYWEKQWQRSVMPTQFQRLLLCLREQQKELKSMYPADSKEKPE